MQQQDLLRKLRALTIAAVWGATICASSAGLTTSPSSPWSAGVSFGRIDFEGDEGFEDAFISSFQLGYTISDCWTIEGVMDIEPSLDDNYQNSDGNSSAAGISIDALFHLPGCGRIDPYLAGGVGVMRYADEVDDSRTDPLLRAGGGLMVRISSDWAFRADARVLLAGDDTEFNLITTAGLCWHPGGGRSSAIMPVSLPPAEAAPAAVAPPASTTAIQPPATPPWQGSNKVQRFELDMNFAEGQWAISPEYFSQLDAIGAVIRNDPGSKVRIEGHVERTAAAPKAALALTQKRADAVRDYFARKCDIATGRIDAVGRGYEQPLKPSATAAADRRMEIYVIFSKPSP